MAKHRIFLGLITFHILAIVAINANDNCTINLDTGSSGVAPLIVQNKKFLYPQKLNDNNQRTIDIADGSKVEYICQSSPDTPSTIRDGLPVLNLTCSDRRFLTEAGSGTYVYTLECSNAQVPKIIRTPHVFCSKEGADGRTTDLSYLTLVQIGWEVHGQFKEQIRLCVDELLYATLWTTHEIFGSSINLRDTSPERPQFQRDTPGDSRLFARFPTQTTLVLSYTRSKQIEAITTILGKNLNVNGDPLIEEGFRTSLYLARGHLSPDADFVYDAEQDATYYFVNAAPQFQAFNNGNWKACEGAIRSYAESEQSTVRVFTGTFGILKYKGSTGKLKPLYLYPNDGNKWIPVPEYYWKVIHNPETNEAIAFVGYNNPHAKMAPEKMCKNQCSKLSWADWNMDNLYSGYMYCCQLEELRESISYLPDLRDANGVWPDLLSDYVAPVIEYVPPGTCVYDLNNRTGSIAPLVIQNGDFLYPLRENDRGHRLVYVYPDQEITLTCHGSVIKGYDLESLTLPCSQTQLLAFGQAINIHALSCAAKNEPTIKKTSNIQCATESINGRSIAANDLELVEIGWNLGGSFRPQIRICQDIRRYVTLWTKHSVQGTSIDFRDKTSDRPSFRRDVGGQTRFFTHVTQTELNEAYSKRSQVTQLTTMLGSSFTLDNSEPIIDESSSSTTYFAKGHLSPDAAFVYDAQQDATYYFMNVAPQFQTFNNGNWKAMEGAVRDYAISAKATIDVYTGTYGHLFYNKKLNTGSSKRTYINLMDVGSNSYLPIPKYFWKVIHNPLTSEAVAFVGVNDAHLTSKPSRICSNVCDQIAWADWDMDNLESGYMYCCTVEDLKTTVDYVPDLSKATGSWPNLMH
ncbi:uncharacterized protein LOC131892971 [Tigriopus californicus]|uniref:uncharacterized protein LOC131892971 n=1 Tax=Tigriopus californicus TaxID=6832 RepID=UPI0027D9E3DF|nr:uncharacterized protein LOC131892971 [Tigriopus californicus]